MTCVDGHLNMKTNFNLIFLLLNNFEVNIHFYKPFFCIFESDYKNYNQAWLEENG